MGSTRLGGSTCPICNANTAPRPPRVGTWEREVDGIEVIPCAACRALLLPIVGWFDEHGAHLSTWIGETRRIRVRNFDERRGVAQHLTADDIVEHGGTEVIVLTDA